MKLGTETVTFVPRAALAAILRISAASQSRAAPMPRVGSVWVESVCRVPNETSLVIVAFMRFGSICAAEGR